MERKLSPYWALIIGLIVVPLASGLNTMLVLRVTGQSGFDGRSAISQFWVCSVLALIFSTPLAMLTCGLIGYWNEGRFAFTRLFCSGLTAMAYGAWRLYYSVLGDYRLGTQEAAFACTILFLPLIWTFLFPVFVLCVREPTLPN